MTATAASVAARSSAAPGSSARIRIAGASGPALGRGGQHQGAGRGWLRPGRMSGRTRPARRRARGRSRSRAPAGAGRPEQQRGIDQRWAGTGSSRARPPGPGREAAPPRPPGRAGHPASGRRRVPPPERPAPRARASWPAPALTRAQSAPRWSTSGSTRAPTPSARGGSSSGQAASERTQIAPARPGSERPAERQVDRHHRQPQRQRVEQQPLRLGIDVHEPAQAQPPDDRGREQGQDRNPGEDRAEPEHARCNTPRAASGRPWPARRLIDERPLPGRHPGPTSGRARAPRPRAPPRPPRAPRRGGRARVPGRRRRSGTPASASAPARAAPPARSG